jgi:hypothetical protein
VEKIEATSKDECREESNITKILMKLVKEYWTGITGLRNIAIKFGVPSNVVIFFWQAK